MLRRIADAVLDGAATDAVARTRLSENAPLWFS
jgi:hypothetical protein